MPGCPTKPITLALIGMGLMPLQGLEIRNYQAGLHDRFTGFPSSPVENPGFLIPPFTGATSFPAIGWQVSDTRKQFTLVTRSHALFATHFASANGSQLHFLNATGQVVTRTIASRVAVKNADNTSSDLLLVTLDSPIDFADGITPLPYFSNATIGTDLVVFGRTARAGTGTIDNFSVLNASGLNTTDVLRFTYNFNGNGDSDCRLQTGDSGSPSLGRSGNTTGIVGIHSAIATLSNRQFNYDAFVPAYVDKIDQIVGSSGYRMTPTAGGNTSLTGNLSVLTTTPRKGNSLDVEFQIQNTGINLTGNLEIEFGFDPGEGPDSISGTDWIAYGSGDEWTLRRSTLDPGQDSTLTLSWIAAPSIDTLEATLDWRSDKSSSGTTNLSIELGESFSDWANGLAEAEPTDDPDDDGLLNQSEYAFGGDPLNGEPLLPTGESLLPSLSGDGGFVVLTFPERSDKVERGLSYIPEWSTDLSPSSWTSTPPTGMNSSTAAYEPEVPGFVKRTVFWPASEPFRFVRIGVLLNE